MTGVVAAVCGCMGRAPMTATISVGAESVWIGYGTGVSVGNDSVGSCSGSNCGLPATCGLAGSGRFIGNITTLSYDFNVEVSGTSISQTCFAGIRVLDQSGFVREYLTADAAAFTTSGITRWSWGSGLNRVWTAPIAGRTIEWF